MPEFESWGDYTDEAADTANYDDIEMDTFNKDATEFMKDEFSQNGIEASDTAGTIKDGSMLDANGEPIKVKGPNGDVDVPESITDPEISSDDIADAVADGLLGDNVSSDIKDNVKEQIKQSVDQNPERIANADQAEITSDTDAGSKASDAAKLTPDDVADSPGDASDAKNQAAAQSSLGETKLDKITDPAKAQQLVDEVSKKLDPLIDKVDGLGDKLDKIKSDIADKDKMKEAGGVGKYLITAFAGLFTYSLIKARQNYLNGCWRYSSDGSKCKSNIMTCNNDMKPQPGDGCSPDADSKSCLPATSSSKIARILRRARVTSTGKPLGTTAPVKYIDPNCSPNVPCTQEGSADVSSSCSCKARACKDVTYTAVTGTGFFDAFNNLIGIPGNLANNAINAASNIIQTLLKIAKVMAVIAAVVVGIIIIFKIIQFFFKKN